MRTEEGGIEEMFWRAVSEGWVKGLRWSFGSGADETLVSVGNCVALERGEWSRERVTWRLRIRRPGDC